ncbi:glycosyltransferase family 2 protein [Paraburkholderia sp.]|uniref:glycosyltransferase family 2 protein n=1 Tax=Paraburkholderia sp. TaxID=1926495 RepID=UPI00286F36DF|nr:glycosyltransferase family 2 protein [Paraburkholderia sp.]
METTTAMIEYRDKKSCAHALISLVVPFYNEAPIIAAFFDAVVPVLRGISDADYEIICVNDGSTDSTLDKLLAACKDNFHIQVVDLSRNFGKEAALTAGIDAATGSVVIPFDADLQDPPQVIAKLVERWRDGYDVVLAKRVERRSDTYVKRGTAALFYRIHNAIADITIPENSGDFRLMSRQVVESLKRLPENRRYMKGLFAWVGFRTAQIEYARCPRVGGKTKFSGWKLWNLALEGVTSFSTLPLRIWTYMGGFTAVFAICYAIYLIVRTWLKGVDVPGYASLIVAVLFLGGIQLVGIGVVGEYIGRIYMESKRRPVYIVRNTYRFGKS